jgi:hypothetical protein
MLFDFLFHRYFVAQPETKLVLSASSWIFLNATQFKKTNLKSDYLVTNCKMGTPLKSIDIDILVCLALKVLEYNPS